MEICCQHIELWNKFREIVLKSLKVTEKGEFGVESERKSKKKIVQWKKYMKDLNTVIRKEPEMDFLKVFNTKVDGIVESEVIVKFRLHHKLSSRSN